MLKVAFIMSVYAADQADWLRAALDSMLNQTFPAEQIHLYVCADGPLTPELEACLVEYTGRIYKLIRNETNRKLAFSLNRLIDSLEDETYVLRMDADDVCEPNRVSLQVALMESRPELLVCGGSIQEFDGDTSVDGLKRTYPQTTAEMRRYIVKASPFAHPTVCFRRSFFSEVGKYNSSLPAQQDIELWFRAVEQNVPMANLSEILLRFRTHGGLAKRRSGAAGRREMKIYSHGIYRLYGIHPFLIWPLLRLTVRLMPDRVTQLIYSRNVRKLLNK